MGWRIAEGTSYAAVGAMLTARIIGCGKLGISLVPEAGLEPAQGCPYRILSPARLPFHHSGTGVIADQYK